MSLDINSESCYDISTMREEEKMSNTRFVKKDAKLDYATLDALITFYQEGGVITKAKPTKRPKRGYTVGKKSQPLKG